MDIIYILRLVLFLLIIIFIPDFFIPKIISRLNNNLQNSEENKDWLFFSKILGWVERALCGFFFILFQQQFITFVGFWLTFKAVGSFNNWQPVKSINRLDDYSLVQSEFIKDDNEKINIEYQRRRAKYMIFTIGTGLSILWVLFIISIFKIFE